ncbi:hypothetical protein T439DRAFT_376135 [Meredithblackwellia eburnea MCA 4105]
MGKPSNMAPPPPPTYSNQAAQGDWQAALMPYRNEFDLAASVREVDEQQMQNMLQDAQRSMAIYNEDIEPEHETEFSCSCKACRYRYAKFSRRKTHDIWSDAVKYPGEKTYSDMPNSIYGPSNQASMFSNNPYVRSVMSPYGPSWTRVSSAYYQSRPIPKYHEQSILQTIALNNELNAKAVRLVEGLEPSNSIWEATMPPTSSDGRVVVPPGGFAPPPGPPPPSSSEQKKGIEAGMNGLSLGNGNGNLPPPPQQQQQQPKRSSGFFSKLLGGGSNTVPSSQRIATTGGGSTSKSHHRYLEELPQLILKEERGRWPDEETRAIAVGYQEKVGMRSKIVDLRARMPIQYYHLLKAGYFEPIPTSWSEQVSNPLKFSIEAAGGWRGVTPAWRGYEDTAEERLYWVLNHREGTTGTRLKPDFISEMRMAQDRMARAVEPPPEYFSDEDQCHVQHTTSGYSKQVMPPAFRAYDRAEVPTDDTMILLDVSSSMDFDPLRPVYDRYMVTNYQRSTQPKNKDVAKAIVRRFVHAMARHDHLRENSGYDLVTFSSSASYAGRISDQNFARTWRSVQIGGGTRVMTGWQKVKQLHFEKHRESATWHPKFGWQAGPETPMLRLLLLLDGEATDMDEFELDLLGLSWAHVTIFLIGVDGCPHHHRHANELQRISEVNHHVSFVDAQGNTPERFVTHELLKRHLGMDISMLRFEELEQLPPYAAVV